jgi:uncharacterized protein
MYELRLHERVKDIPREQWDALAEPGASPFVEWTWLDCLEEAGCVGGKTGWLPLHFGLYEDGRLVALAPAYAKMNSEGEFVFDWSWADASHRAGVPYYPKLVIAVPFTPATGDRVLVAEGVDAGEVVRMVGEATKKWLVETEVSGAHALFLREAEAQAWGEAGFSERLGVQYHWARNGATTFDGYLARFNSKRRNQIRREMSQPAKDGLTLSTLEPHELTPDVVGAMFELYAANVDKHYYGRRYLNLRFFELVAERYAHRLAWVVARRGKEIVASAFNVQKGNRLYGRYWGAKVDLPFLHFNVCYYHGIRHAIDHGLDHFEPGAGGEHKKARGFDPTLTRSVHWIAEGRMRRAIEAFLQREREAVRAYVEHGREPR